MDAENKYMDTKWEVGGDRNWETGNDMYTIDTLCKIDN